MRKGWIPHTQWVVLSERWNLQLKESAPLLPEKQMREAFRLSVVILTVDSGVDCFLLLVRVPYIILLDFQQTEMR